MSDLTKFDRVGPLSVPPKADLLLARRAIHVSPDLQRLFDDAVTEGWDVERLAGALEDGLFRFVGQEVGAETARYLAEEFEARDKTQTLLVSAETGLAVAQIPQDALYQPGPVPREGTDKLATPSMRLKPEIEAAIIQHHHVRGVEDGLIGKLQVRVRSSELQRTEGDARLRIATRTGRKGIAAQLFEELPTLLQDHRGSLGRLLSLCHVNEPVPGSHSVTLELSLFTHASLLVADGLATNFRYDAYGLTRERIRGGWTRSLARAIARSAHRNPPAHVGSHTDLGEGLLIAEPDVIRAVRHANKLLAPDSPAAILRGSVYLTLGLDHQLNAYEAEARWNVDAWIGVCLHLDPESLEPIVFTDVIESSVLVEVLQ
jgi:hypothetical protein